MADPSIIAQMAGVSAFVAALGGLRVDTERKDGQRETSNEEHAFLQAFAHNALAGKRFFVGLAKAGAVIGGIISAAVAVWQYLHEK